MTDIAVTPK